MYYASAFFCNNSFFTAKNLKNYGNLYLNTQAVL